MEKRNTPPVGRFAPTPSGRMHLGNVFAALIAWLSVRSRGGSLVLRMEDLDTQRTSREFAQILRQDLLWLGLDWDEETQPQSQRSEVYQAYFDDLAKRELLYPCYCTRSQLHSVNAPHLSDGTYVYPGTCRDLTEEQKAGFSRQPAWRVKVPDKIWQVDDLLQGTYRENLATDCGDFSPQSRRSVCLPAGGDGGRRAGGSDGSCAGCGSTQLFSPADVSAGTVRISPSGVRPCAPSDGAGRKKTQQAGSGSGSGRAAPTDDTAAAHRISGLHRGLAGKAGGHQRQGTCPGIFLAETEERKYLHRCRLAVSRGNIKRRWIL